MMSARAHKSSRSVSITVVDSEDVVQHIVESPHLDRKKMRRKASNASRNLEYTTTFKNGDHSLASDDSDDDSNIDALTPRAAADTEDSPTESGEETMQGKSMFKFRTPKKSGQMALKALGSLTPSSPVGRSPATKLPMSPLAVAHPQAQSKRRGSAQDNLASPLPAARTPTRARKSLDAGHLTPHKSHGVAAVREHKRPESSTPYRLRKRLVESRDSSSEDDSVDESSEEEEEEKEDAENRAPPLPSRRDAINTAASAESYFDLHAGPAISSDRTLASLDGPRLSLDTVRSVLAGLKDRHAEHKARLGEAHAGLFNRWMLQMCFGFNLLLHGLGSKRDLMEKFRLKHLAKFSHLVVNGYFPSLTVKHILNSITEDILECSKGFTNPRAQVDFIKEQYQQRDEDFYLVIHNLDGVLLRGEKSQAILSLLAEIPGFHIIASIDHINAGFMWDQTRYFRCRWLWHETQTFAPYTAENSYDSSLLVQQSGALALSSLSHVLASLTPNARRIFLMLASHQAEHAATQQGYIGMPFSELYHKCREAFLVNSDLTLQAQLVEFKDHQLLKAKKNFEGIEHLTIPMDLGTLKEFLNDYKDD